MPPQPANASGPLHIRTIASLTEKQVLEILDRADDLKKTPSKYSESMKQKTLLMLFSKPSLRTRVSFETGMTRMGGHAIFYSIADSPLGVKESYSDTANCLSRFVDVIMARVPSKADIEALATNATIPVINALDDWGHPCQMLADMMAIREKKGKLRGLKMAYFGDTKNNVTYDLMRSAALMGFEIAVCGPTGSTYEIAPEVIAECKELCAKSGGKVTTTHDVKEAATGADVVYTDSWMSYGIPKAEAEVRSKALSPFQVNDAVMKMAKPDAIFMNCLPAARGMEQTASVIDGPQSIVFDQAENRMHAQNSLLITLTGGK